MCAEIIAKHTVNQGKPTAMAVWQNPIVDDNSGEVAHVVCNPPSGTNVTIGQTKITCEAVDGSGNKPGCNFDVNLTGTHYWLRWIVYLRVVEWVTLLRFLFGVYHY